MDERNNHGHGKRLTDDSSDSDTPQLKKIRQDLLGLLDDSDSFPAFGSEIEDLDSLMKSFEKELSTVEPTSGSGESLPEIGFLQQSSDDQLATGQEEENRVDELVRVMTESEELGDEVSNEGKLGNEYLALDAMLEFSDVNVEPSEYVDVTWRSETLPAL